MKGGRLVESPENANVAAEAGETSPARSPRRWQFTLAGLLTLTTLVAVALSLASPLGWDRVAILLSTVAMVTLFALCIFAPAVATTLWRFLRHRAPRLRIVVPAAFLAVIGLPVAAIAAMSLMNNHLLEGGAACGLLLYWIPQFFLWVAEAQRLERAEARAEADPDPLSPPAESETMDGSPIRLPGRERSP